MDGFLYQASIYLAAAVFAVPIASRFGFASVLGYLIAGILIGPFLEFVGSETEGVQHFAEFGVVMMLFLIGLQIEPRAFWDMRHRLLGLGGLQISLSAVAIMAACMALGLAWNTSLAIGLTLSLSSTAIVLQTLSEKGLMHTGGGRNIFSVLLAQDIAVIPILAFLPLLAVGIPMPFGTTAHAAEDTSHNLTLSLVDGLPGWGVTLVTISAVAAIILLGVYAVRPLFRFIHAARLRELQTALALLIVTSISFLMTLVGLSPALGAFIAGMVLASSEFRHELEADIEPFKGLLIGLFFITVGAGVNFDLLLSNTLIIFVITLLLMAIKGVVLLWLGWVFQLRRRDLWLFAFGLVQAGEFGFVLTAFALQQNVMPSAIGDILLLVIALTMILTPLLWVVADKIFGRVFGPMKETGLGELRVFLSYSRNDTEQMRNAARLLESNGFKVYYDDRNLPFGEKWKTELRYLIEQADVVVWLVSRSSVESYWCNWELEQIAALGKKWVPVSIGNVPLNELPDGITERQIFPGKGCFDTNNQEQVDALVSVLGNDYSWVKHYTRLSDHALAWDKANRLDDKLLPTKELLEAEKWRTNKPPLAPDPMPLVLDLIHRSRVVANKSAE